MLTIWKNDPYFHGEGQVVPSKCCAVLILLLTNCKDLIGPGSAQIFPQIILGRFSSLLFQSRNWKGENITGANWLFFDGLFFQMLKIKTIKIVIFMFLNVANLIFPLIFYSLERFLIPSNVIKGLNSFFRKSWQIKTDAKEGSITIHLWPTWSFQLNLLPK